MEEEARSERTDAAQRLSSDAPIGLCYYDVDLRYRYINKWLARINGIPVEAHLGKTTDELLENVAPRVVPLFRRVLDTGEPILEDEIEVETPAHPGELRHYSCSYYPDTQEDGRVVGISCVVQDITERKEAEEALREAHDKLEERVKERTAELELLKTRLTVAQRIAKIGSWEANLVTKDIWWSSETYDIFGVDPEAFTLTREAFLELVHADDRQRVIDAHQGSIADGTPLSIFYHIVRADGSERAVQTQAEVILNEQGQALRITGTIHDITERKKADEALAVSETRLKKAQRIASVGSWDWNIVTDERWWSDQIYRIFAIERETVTPSYEAFLEMVHPTDRKAVNNAVERALQNREPYATEYRIVLPNGSEKTILTHAEVTFDAEGRPTQMTGTIHDITSQRKLEEQLRQAQKMQAVGQLTGGMAHNFNNLLAVVVGRLEILENASVPEEMRAASVGAAMDASQLGADLVKRLLAFSGQQHLRPQDLNINTWVKGLAPLLKSTLGEEIEFRTKLAEDLGQTVIDNSQLENTLVNLAINARDAMPEGGSLTIETGNIELEETEVVDEGEVAGGGYVMLAVSDTGTGIPKHVRPHIFEPFFTTKDVDQGTGLGLSMVHGFVKQSKGHINVYSEEGHGTTIKVYLPRSGDGSEETAETSARHKALPRGEETIMLVEDEVAVRETAALLLRSLGYRVLEANDGSKAMDLLDAHADVDLLFTDIVMPGGMNGVQLAQKAQQLLPSLKVLYTTGYTVSGRSANGLSPDSPDVLTKPYRKKELAHKVRELLDRE